MLILGKKNLPEAVELLKEGKILVFPTETSYGLGCDAANQEAVDRIFKIKGRRSGKPLLVVAPTIAMAKKYLVWNNLLARLAKKYWPGAVTVVGERRCHCEPPQRAKQSHGFQCHCERPQTKSGGARQSLAIQSGQSLPGGGIASSLPSVAPRNDMLAAGVLSEKNTLALRVTASPVPKFLSARLGRPLVATSANIADAGDLYSVAEVVKIFQKRKYRPDAVIDAGVLPRRAPTTIASVVGGRLKILRQGDIMVV